MQTLLTRNKRVRKSNVRPASQMLSGAVIVLVSAFSLVKMLTSLTALLRDFSGSIKGR